MCRSIQISVTPPQTIMLRITICACNTASPFTENSWVLWTRFEKWSLTGGHDVDWTHGTELHIEITTHEIAVAVISTIISNNNAESWDDRATARISAMTFHWPDRVPRRSSHFISILYFHYYLLSDTSVERVQCSTILMERFWNHRANFKTFFVVLASQIENNISIV